MEQRRARGMLAAAAVIFGTLAPFVRGISVSSGELALYRAVMAALLVGGYLLVSGQKLALRANRREAALLLLSGMAMGVNWILLFEAYRYTTVSVATLSYYFAPVLVTAACPLLFHERLTGKQIVCFVMSTLGLVLVIGVGGSAASRMCGACSSASARRRSTPRSFCSISSSEASRASSGPFCSF
ncbi:MAG: DMT family transporter [Oscillospiraceae bacterium]